VLNLSHNEIKGLEDIEQLKQLQSLLDLKLLFNPLT